MQKEIWKDIPGYEYLYMASIMGRIYSLNRIDSLNRVQGGFIIKQIKDKSKGYMHVSLSKNGKLKSFRTHQLIALTFLNHNPSRLYVIDHINNIKDDNRLLNLQIISQRENTSKDQKGITSKHVGVHLNTASNKFMSTIRVNGKKKHLGYFKNEHDAHLAYQKELSILKSHSEANPIHPKDHHH